MLGIVIAILVVVVLHLMVTLYLNLWGVATLERAISRQDDRLRKRAERAVAEDDEDNLGQIADGLRAIGIEPNEEDSLMARHPGARLPEELYGDRSQ